MAQIKVQFRARKRWFFWPLLIFIGALGRLGILRDPSKAAKWLANHAMRLEVI